MTEATLATEELLVRLRRAEGQLRGVQRMLDEGAQGAAVLTQLAAVKAALDQVGLKLISQELRRCRLAGEDACEEDFEAALTTLLRYTTMAR